LGNRCAQCGAGPVIGEAYATEPKDSSLRYLLNISQVRIRKKLAVKQVPVIGEAYATEPKDSLRYGDMAS
jgi:ribosomal protein L28